MNREGDEPKDAPAQRSQPSAAAQPEFPADGALLGIDYGSKRIGIALSTPDRSVASPLETYTRRNEALDARYFRELVADYRVVGLVVGLPVHLAGHESQSSRDARRFADWLAGITGLPVTFCDERFTTSVAEDAMLALDLTRRQRKARIDKLAAQVMLQAFLDAARRD